MDGRSGIHQIAKKLSVCLYPELAGEMTDLLREAGLATVVESHPDVILDLTVPKPLEVVEGLPPPNMDHLYVNTSTLGIIHGRATPVYVRQIPGSGETILKLRIPLGFPLYDPRTFYTSVDVREHLRAFAAKVSLPWYVHPAIHQSN